MALYLFTLSLNVWHDLRVYWRGAATRLRRRIRAATCEVHWRNHTFWTNCKLAEHLKTDMFYRHCYIQANYLEQHCLIKRHALLASNASIYLLITKEVLSNINIGGYQFLNKTYASCLYLTVFSVSLKVPKSVEIVETNCILGIFLSSCWQLWSAYARFNVIKELQNEQDCLQKDRPADKQGKPLYN